MSREDPVRLAAEARLLAAFRRLLALVEQRDAPPADPEPWLGGISLSGFETDLLLLLAGAEIDGALAAAIAARPEATGGAPCFALAMSVLPGAHWSAIAPGGALRRWRLMEVDGAAPLAAAPLRIDERILHHLLGFDELDGRLAGIVRHADDVPLAPSQAALVEPLSECLRRGSAVALCGDDSSGMAGVAACIARQMGTTLLTIDAGLVPAAPAETEALGFLARREAALSGAVLLLAAEDALPEPALRLAARLDCPLVIAAREPVKLGRPLARAEVRKPDAPERLALWRAALPTLPGADSARLAVTYRLSAAAIAAEAWAQPEAAGVEAIEQSCRIAGRARLEALATRVRLCATFDDLVLPEAERAMLQAIAAQMRARPLVDLAWPAGSRGLGLAVLFAGESGTGKTMAAEAIASELGLDLYRVDLAQTVSKYIGETAKNLRALFDAAEESGAVLLFDEADALFGKRSEVRDAHDRYANIETGYLLQRLETYSGLAILTTNLRHSLDPAFQRRLRFIVSFPFPDQAARTGIWERAFPEGIDTEAVDPARLGQLMASGGAIRVVALNAAFAAVNEGMPVSMRHILAAAHFEAAKRERPLADAETRTWL